MTNTFPLVFYNFHKTENVWLTFYCAEYEVYPSVAIHRYLHNDDVIWQRLIRDIRRPGRRKSYRTLSFLSFVTVDRSRSSRPVSPVPRTEPHRFACGCSDSRPGDSLPVGAEEGRAAS